VPIGTSDSGYAKAPVPIYGDWGLFLVDKYKKIFILHLILSKGVDLFVHAEG
jgi:hypothetical protein